MSAAVVRKYGAVLIRSLAVVVLAPLFCSAQLTTNVIERVFLIAAGAERGTAFTIEVDSRQYLITAKHVVKDLKSDDAIQIRKNDTWSTLPVRVYRCDDPVDIAVLIPPTQLSVDFPLQPTSDGLLFGAEVFFMGFPYGKQTDAKMSGGYPVGVAKRATYAGMGILVRGRGQLYVLDGYNNPGYSGAPVVFAGYGAPGRDFKVAAVIVGFLPEAGPLLKGQKIESSQITAEDTQQSRILEYEGEYYRVTPEETTRFVRLNSGLAFAHDIKFALELIRLHPIGPKVADNFQPK